MRDAPHLVRLLRAPAHLRVTQRCHSELPSRRNYEVLILEDHNLASARRRWTILVPIGVGETGERVGGKLQRGLCMNQVIDGLGQGKYGVVIEDCAPIIVLHDNKLEGCRSSDCQSSRCSRVPLWEYIPTLTRPLRVQSRVLDVSSPLLQTIHNDFNRDRLRSFSFHLFSRWPHISG